MTNYEKIKSMSVKEMAEFIDIYEMTDVCQRCAYNELKRKMMLYMWQIRITEI